MVEATKLLSKGMTFSTQGTDRFVSDHRSQWHERHGAE
jgi:hypothetical protein